MTRGRRKIAKMESTENGRSRVAAMKLLRERKGWERGRKEERER